MESVIGLAKTHRIAAEVFALPPEKQAIVLMIVYQLTNIGSLYGESLLQINSLFRQKTSATSETLWQRIFLGGRLLTPTP